MKISYKFQIVDFVVFGLIGILIGEFWYMIKLLLDSNIDKNPSDIIMFAVFYIIANVLYITCKKMRCLMHDVTQILHTIDDVCNEIEREIITDAEIGIKETNIRTKEDNN